MALDVNIQATKPNGLDNQTQQPVSAPAAAPASDEILREIAALRAENARLQAKATQVTANRITMRVSPKGALSLYGLGRFPVTEYKEQWLKILDMADDIRAFIKDHDKELKAKGQ